MNEIGVFGPCPNWCVVTIDEHLKEFDINDSKFVTHKSALVEVETNDVDHNWIPITTDVVMCQRIERDGDRFKAFEPVVELAGGAQGEFALSRAVDLAEVIVNFAGHSAEWRDSEEARSTLEEI